MLGRMADPSGAETFRLSGDAYDRHVGRYTPALAVELCEFAGVAGGSALDVGCGPGALAAELTGRADAVAAVDPSEPFIGACKERLPGVDARRAQAEDLPFADASFDAVLSQLVVNFLDDTGLALSEMVRVTRPGGTVAAAVWDYAGEMTLLRAFWDAAAEVDSAAADLDEGRSMPFCRPHELEELWVRAGVTEVRTAALVVEARYEGFDDLWAPFPLGVGPSGAFVAALDGGERREAMRAAFERRLGSPPGPFTLTARAWAVSGTKPR
jgi:SAM-dependent methyltransferase